MIIIVTISIFMIMGLAWLLNKTFRFRICPICAGVSGTWLWMLIALFLGYKIDPALPALLMGGSVVGAAYQLEKRLPSEKLSLLWKALFIPAGFIAVYGLLVLGWEVFLPAIIFLGVIVLIFFVLMKKNNKNNAAAEDLEKKMKQCC
ncbi:MAG: hypothetical protein G01um10143_569 [Parcubacteria group bacterium Gr01-1014_3]|nr:MAG: hypothetical protein G01um10143_569 [Parcubacteria group bacterium Gr01-1014_3]